MSKIILGTMQYGDKGWQKWVLEEEEALKHIKYAYVLCCNGFFPYQPSSCSLVGMTKELPHSTLQT